ncbi:MAG: YggT family protein [Chloroflexota bacterium]|nr:YggT family protein [Chloroflexota bacterium]
MSIADPVDQTVVTQEPAAVAPSATVTQRRSTYMRPENAELGRRVVVLLFGLVQIVIALRVVLLALNAREGNVLVSGILNVSQLFVAPFNGVLHTNALQSGGSILDLAAIVALVGWTVLELIVLWSIGIFRREPA